MVKRSLLFFFSLIILALGQEDFVPVLAPIAALCGYALFWEGRFSFKIAFLFGTLLYGIKLLWVANPEQLGYFILLFYLLISMVLGLIFAGLSTLVKKEMGIIKCLQIAALFTLAELFWSYVWVGFPWNPAGMSLGAMLWPRQAASLLGIYGLSFLVYLVNLLLVSRYFKLSFALAVLPYLFGLWYVTAEKEGPKAQVLIVQTGMAQESKQKADAFEYWERVFSLVAPHLGESIEMIVLPEGAVPYPANYYVLSYRDAESLFSTYFHQRLPPFELDDAYVVKEVGVVVTNSYLCRALSTLFKAEIIVGMERVERVNPSLFLGYQSLFLFSPSPISFYDKQVLVPLGEMVPFEWCRKLANQFGVFAFFTPGQEMKLLPAKYSVGPTICYEEIFPHLVILAKQLGAQLLVNATNDGWFPGSLLARQHLAHARIRTVECGLPLVRATTTGVSAAIDCYGQTVAEAVSGKQAFLASVPLTSHTTLFEKIGNSGIFLLCLVFGLLPWFFSLKKKCKKK